MAITIDLSVLGNGNYTIEDDGTPGNGVSVVRDPDGNVVTFFAHPADSLTILSRAGQSISVNITDSLTTANFTVGSLTDASVRPDTINIGGVVTSGTVTLAANDTVNEWGNDGSTDVVAGTLLIEAGNGIAGDNALETQVSVLEAESAAGDINISNNTNVQIGGATAELRGLYTGTGNIILNNSGSVTLTDIDGVESVRSGGDLTINAQGSSANITSTVNRDALLAVGDIFLSAGQDVSFGTTGTDFDNDVRAGGGITITAGRDFTIDGFSDMAADDQGLGSNGGVSITTGRHILISDFNGVDASVGISSFTGTGSVVLTAGIGSYVYVSANSSAAIFSRSGGVTINADILYVEADSGITVGNGGAVEIGTRSPGRAINLGPVFDSGTALDISDVEIDRIFTDNLVIGSSTSGAVNVTSAISANIQNLSLWSTSNIWVGADLSNSGSLSLNARGNVTQTAASIINAPSLTINVDTPDHDVPGGQANLAGWIGGTNTTNGNADADTLNGTANDNLMNGLAGNDTLNGGDGNDVLNGGAGDDTINGQGGTADLASYATAGSAVTLNLAIVGAQNTGGDGTDTLTGVEGAVGSQFADSLNGDGGANIFYGGDGDDIVSGLVGNDALYGGNGNDSLSGGDGVDTLEGGLGNDTLNGGAGTDTASFASASAFVVVSLGIAGAQNTRAGTDTLTSIEKVIGSDFNDQLTGGTGNDRLEGGLGNDLLVGAAGNDTFFGGDGDDRIEGGAGDDIINGNTGRDTAIYSSAGSGVTVSLATDLAQNTGGAGVDTLNSIERLVGSNHADTLSGNTSNNVIFGDGGSDTISGDAGSDVLYGGQGNDQLTGGAGQDSFMFDAALNISTNVDTITDFTVSYDKIRLSEDVFTTAGAAGTLDAAAFRAGTAAGDSSDRIIYDSTTGNIYYDADGTGGIAQILFAQVTPGTLLTNADFIIGVP